MRAKLFWKLSLTYLLLLVTVLAALDLYATRAPHGQLLAAAVTIVVAATTLTAGQIFFRYLGTQLETFWYWLTGLL